MRVFFFSVFILLDFLGQLTGNDLKHEITLIQQFVEMIRGSGKFIKSLIYGNLAFSTLALET